jgi:3-oxoacyl-[acyl-carrier protein] reductase
MADFLGGSVAIVAGGEGGIGRASTVRLAELGARVAVLDRDLDGAAEYGEKLTAPSVRDELRDRADDGLAIQVDQADSGRTQQAIDDVADRWGRLDSLVIPAGGAITPYPRSAASATSDEDFQALVDTNMRTVVNCRTSHAEVRRRGDRDHGEQRALVVSSGGFLAGYAMTKAAVVQHSRYLAAEVGRSGMRVNCIAAGVIRTARVVAQSAAWSTTRPPRRSR